MEERARGLARHFVVPFEASFDFRDEHGLQALLRAVGTARRHDVLWLLAQHPSRVIGAAIGRLLFKTSFVVDTGDLLAESERTKGRSRVWCRLVAWWERRTYRWPDAVVVRGTAHVPIALAAGAKRVVLLPDGVEVDEFAPRDPGGSAMRARLRAEGQVTIGVIATISVDAGSGLPSPGWDVVETLARLPEQKLVGVIVGDGPGLEPLKRLAERLGVAGRMRWIGRVAAEELPAWTAAIDIFLHTALNNRMSAVRTTGKLPLLLAAGSAAVVSKVGEAARVLDGTGMLLDFDCTPDSYADRLAARVRLLIERKELARWREAGPEIARREFDYPVLGERAGALVASLVPHD